jgi:protein-S-isoprenylcysteine O-methyltransferase Ste14
LSRTRKDFLTRSNLRNLVLLLSLASSVFYSITEAGMLIGFLLLAVGCFLHLLSKGVLIRSVVLTRKGIYGIIRHPYYLSNYLIDSSLCVLSGNPYLLLAYPFLFFWAYGPTLRKEEAYLSSLHGHIVTRYLSEIPQLFPDQATFNQWKRLFEGFCFERITRKECVRIMRFCSLGLFIALIQEIRADGLSVLADLIRPTWHDYDEFLFALLAITFYLASLVLTNTARQKRYKF